MEVHFSFFFSCLLTIFSLYIYIYFEVDIIDYNTLSLNKYLGGGSYGEVYMGTWQCETVAVKQLSCNSLTRDSQLEFKKEVEIWK